MQIPVQWVPLKAHQIFDLADREFRLRAFLLGKHCLLFWTAKSQLFQFRSFGNLEFTFPDSLICLSGEFV